MFQKPKNIVAAKVSAVAIAVPLVLFAYIGGPDPRLTGAPGDDPLACTSCHMGTAVNGGAGKVEIFFPGGMTYVPGQKQQLTVTVTDVAPNNRVYGFQATARLASNLSAGQAGVFSNININSTQILCDDGSPKGASGCRANFQVEFIEHRSANSTNTFTFEWTPPATDVGNVRIYVAGNAGNGNVQNTGDHIYTANYTLTPSAGGGTRPAISSGGVADAFNFSAGIGPNAFTVIVGTNLANAGTNRPWDDAIEGNQLPTTLSGVSVTVNNRPAAISYASPAQINILTPPDIGTGQMNVVVTNNGVASEPFAVTATTVKPAFYTPFAQDGKFYVTAVALDGTYVGKTGLDPRVTRAARPGEVLLVFGSGFGPTNPALVANQVVTGAPAITTPVRIRFGETVANFAGTGNLVFAGLYQFNVTVPANLADGEYQLFAEQAGVVSSDKVYIVVQR